MIHTFNISDTTAAIYALIAVITVVAAYVYGYTVAQRKHRGYVKGIQEALDIALQKVDDAEKQSVRWQTLSEMFSKQRDQWADKYEKLQQEIECHIHEVHKEMERPHVEYIQSTDKGSTVTERGYQEWIPEAHDETPKDTQNWWNAESEFWESLRRLHKEDTN